MRSECAPSAAPSHGGVPRPGRTAWTPALPAPQPLPEALDASRYGAKAANLAWLHGQGFPTVQGVALDAVWLRAHLAQGAGADLYEALRAGFAAGEAQCELAPRGERLAEWIVAQPLSTQARAYLAQLLEHDGEGPWVVRSSAVGEDSALASFAGQLESVLHCRSLAELERALRQVWASGYRPHCLAYQRHAGQWLDAVGVVLCRQVAAAFAGVLFTRIAAPSGEQALLVEYTEGLADALVAGALTPAQAWFGRVAGELRSHAPAPGASSRQLSAPTLSALARLGSEIERSRGGAVDVEWCVLDDDPQRIVLVQVRPVTAGSARTVHAWSNANVAENFPEPLCPLLASFVARGYHAYFEALGRVFGVPRKALRAKQRALGEIVGTHEGRLYYNLTRIREVCSIVPGGEGLYRSFATFTGAPAPLARTGTAAARAMAWLRTGASLLRHYASIRRRVRRFEARIERYAARHGPGQVRSHDAFALADALQEFLDIRLRHWRDAGLADCAAMLGYSALQALTRRWLPQDYARNEHQGLLKGLDGLPSNQPVLQLWECAQAVRRHPAALAQLLEEDPASLAARLQALPRAPVREGATDDAGRFLHERLAHYIETCGFRSSRELTLVAPTPHEDWRPTLELLRRYATLPGEGPAARLQGQAYERKLLERRLLDALARDRPASLPRRRARVALYRLAIAGAQHGVRLRERVRTRQALLYACLRHVALAGGQALAAQGRLGARDDAFMLGIDELADLLRGRYTYPQDVTAVVAARREAYDAAHRLEPPGAFELEAGQVLRTGVPDNAPVHDADARELCGTAACAGHYEGPVVVLADASEIRRMQPGDVLVTRQTDPGWASAFFLARALVVERGGMLSHGAIVAREFGIPAVVGVHDATRILREGEPVIVDGFEGRVQRCGHSHPP